MSVKSMTGYGRASCIIDGMQINIDLKSVNHRYYDFNSKISKDYIFLEDKIKKTVNEAVSRGKIDFFLYIDSSDSADYDIELNESLAASYAAAFKSISKKLKIKNDLTVSYLTKTPDIIKIKKREIDEAKTEAAVMQALETALASYNEMRAAEGRRLYDDVVSNLEKILANVSEIEKIAPESIEAYKERLRKKMTEALEGREVDEQRVITEAAIFADKIDIGEETVRLRSHISQFRALIDKDGEPVGKKLDFIVQEMNREINTVGSKCNSIEITKYVVDTKSVIEKIREQIQNIE